jgi:hypothetical protein
MRSDGLAHFCRHLLPEPAASADPQVPSPTDEAAQAQMGDQASDVKPLTALVSCYVADDRCYRSGPRVSRR